MSDFSGMRQFRAAAYNSTLQVTAVVSVITGVALLAVGAFLLSYARIHEIAVAAGVSPVLAGLYPLIFDTTLVIACVAALALRGAGWWMRGYAALSIVILLAAVAVVEALQAAGIHLPQRPMAATRAAMPWALFLLGFGLGLSMLSHQRTVRAVALPGDPGNGKEGVGGPGRWEPVVNQRSAGSGLRNAGPDTPDLSRAPAGPKPASPSPGTGTPDVGLTPGPGNEHRHEHRHGHGHGNGHSADD